MLRRYKLKNYNFRLVILLIAISIIGVLLIGSADSADQKKQAIGVVLGVVIMIIVSLLDYSWLLNFYWVLYIGNLMMLGVLYLGGSTAKNTFGATRWIQIGSFQFQPTELSKIFLIMFFAMFLMKHEEDLNTAKTIFTAIGLLIPPLVMIYRQPDLKNTITVMVLFCFMMYVAGLSYKVIAVVLVSGSALVLALLLVITQVNFQLPAALDKTIGYQLGRIQDWLSDDADNADGRLQQQNSITAIGSGKLTGKGLNNNKVSSANKGNFVSQNHNDFIFAVAGTWFLWMLRNHPAPVPDSRRMHPDFPESKRSVRNVDLLRYGRTHCLSELSEYQCCNRNPAEHRYTASVRQLWTDLPCNTLHRNGACPECRTAEPGFCNQKL
jgi:rod shape determining protein RodA